MFGPGGLLSTGDGVLQLRIQISAAAKSRWELRSSGPAMAWTQEPGAGEFTFPIIQKEATGPFVRLVDIGGQGVGGEVEVQVVTDADLDRAEVLPLEIVGPSVYQSSVRTKIPGRNGTIIVQWQGQPQAVRFVVEGTDAAGNEMTVEAAFDKPKSRIAFLSLSPFGAGTMESIRLEGDMNSPVVSLAPQISNR